MSEIVCPQCDKDDRIEKISSVVYHNRVDEGRHKLSLPEKPGKGGFSCFAWLFFLFIAFTGFLSLIIGSLVLVSLFMDSPGDPNEATDLLVGSFMCGIPALLTFAWAISTHRRDKSMHIQQREIWETAKKKWDRLYYCFRNDIVFDPDLKKYFPPEELENYLFTGLDWQTESEVEKAEGIIGIIVMIVGVAYAFFWSAVGSSLRDSSGGYADDASVRRAVDDELNKRGY